MSEELLSSLNNATYEVLASPSFRALNFNREIVLAVWSHRRCQQPNKLTRGNQACATGLTQVVTGCFQKVEAPRVNFNCTFGGTQGKKNGKVEKKMKGIFAHS